ncbi:hypothetical protein P5F55_13770 [Clostridium perfringens]|uniref:hypothetical protein n=1 Tax=Clostridium perfringens TaxID=1502 RepID=UPI002974DB63|nr:hypothetical protein [Clostridium perfringens]MDK0835026.1 hypothetical protein [Clostridium perfringens]MDK0928429.1 hypothetical protein [Clostridium perfringens]MDM0495347.1 hypothetical protein [Clostridium perfringens]MDM0781063.1 hypothetical protein [Clostridium perfringens]
MLRVYVQEGIYIIINNQGKVSNKCFEVVKVRTKLDFKVAIKLFKKLHSIFPSVYMYKVSNGYRVEYKSYFNNLPEALEEKNKVERVLEEFENDK